MGTSFGSERPVAMTVAGSDSGGGAGIQADLLTFDALRVHGTSALTCLTAQNPDGVSDVLPVPGAFVVEQMRQIMHYFSVSAMKTGMLYSAEIIRGVSRFLAENPGIRVVTDPVMVATSGATLLQADAIRTLREDLLPRAFLITPNLDEAAVLLEERPADSDAMIDGGRRLRADYGCAVLMKGGHLEGDRVTDVLIDVSGEPRVFEYARIRETDTHGSGCVFSAAIAAYLARGLETPHAVGEARAFLQQALLKGKVLSGRTFMDPGTGGVREERENR